MKHANYIQSLVEDGNFQQIKLSFKADDQILYLMNKVNSFGKIIIESKLSDADIAAYTQNQAQQRVVNIPVRSGNAVMPKLKQRIKTYHGNVEECCILSNGKMVFTIISPGEVIILHTDGSRDFTINIRSDISNVEGCCILSNGKMVFTIISPGEVILLQEDGSRDFKINIRSGLPRDVTCIDNNTIA